MCVGQGVVSRNGSELEHEPMMEGAALQSMVPRLSSFGEEKTDKEIKYLQGLAEESRDQLFSPC